MAVEHSVTHLDEIKDSEKCMHLTLNMCILNNIIGTCVFQCVFYEGLHFNIMCSVFQYYHNFIVNNFITKPS